MFNRLPQFIFIATFLANCWLLMQAVHELGHVAVAVATGGKVTKVVLHPLAISRTDTIGSRQPLLVVWAGPVVGVVLPLVVLGIVKACKWKWFYLAQFFAGTCLIANVAYIGFGSWQRIGDAGDLIRLGSPIGLLWLFGIITVPIGFWLWNGLGANFGLGQAGGKVDRFALWFSCGLFLAIIICELALSSSQ